MGFAGKITQIVVAFYWSKRIDCDGQSMTLMSIQNDTDEQRQRQLVTARARSAILTRRLRHKSCRT